MRSRGVVPLLMAVLVAVAVVVVSVSSAGAHKVKTAASKPFTVGFANESLQAPFQVDVQNSMVKYAKVHHFKLIAVNNNYTDATALSNAQTLANDHVNVAVEFQVDSKIGPRIAQIFRQAKIPVIAIDIPEPGAIFFGASNFQDGELTGFALGNYIKSHHWNLAKVTEVLLNLPAAGPVPQLRMDGINAGIRRVVPRLPKKALIEVSAGDGTTSVSQQTIASLLPRIPAGNHIVVSAINDESLVGALRAVQLARRESSSVFAGQGSDPVGLPEIRSDAHWIGDTAYFPELYGKYIMQLVADIKAKKHIEPFAFMPRVFIDKANINQYYPGKHTVTIKLPPGGLEFSKTAKLTYSAPPPNLP
jgi:ribose transport system substrate-binding protein